MDPRKTASEWFYKTVFQEEQLPRRQEKPAGRVPAAIQAARTLERESMNHWQSRGAIFLKQGKLLENYKDDYPGTVSVTRYFPTYQSFTDEELRCYFSWRTRLRRGEVTKTCLSFAFLYIYELINQIGAADPLDGYQKLSAFARDYGQLDDAVLPYLNRWLTDYVVYYRLPGQLLEGTAEAAFDRNIQIFADLENRGQEELAQAVEGLAPNWLGRSRFCREHRADMDTVLCRVLRRLSRHYASCKRPLVEQMFGIWRARPTNLFESAVIGARTDTGNFDYWIDPVRVYRCSGGCWSMQSYDGSPEGRKPLEDLIRTVDSQMRQTFDSRHPIKPVLKTKWILKIIQEEVQKLAQEKQASERKKLRLDPKRLAQIRADAAITQDKLTVEEEPDEQENVSAPLCLPTEKAAEPGDELPLTGAEYRLVRCLLYGGGLDWLREEGYIVSVLVDGINEKLYDTFQDTVLEDPPGVVEDYIEELKRMVRP